jgi:cytidylate kinase
VGDVVIVTGPPGAGKSTVSTALAALFHPSALVPGDVFFTFVRHGAVDPWLEEAAEQNAAVTESAGAAVGRLAHRYDVVYDGVVGPWLLPAFLSAAGLESVHYVMLLPPLPVCVERVAARTNHGFTDLAAARHMWESFRSGVDGLEQHVVEESLTPTDLAALIARRVGENSLRYIRSAAASS